MVVYTASGLVSFQSPMPSFGGRRPHSQIDYQMLNTQVDVVKRSYERITETCVRALLPPTNNGYDMKAVD